MKNIEEVLGPMQKNIKRLNVNGLNGRMLRLKASNKLKVNYRREILLVYGHHSSLERMYGIAEVLNQYGTVTMPDLPGFGGMDSFYTIGMEPTIDNMADYLATFIKLRYRRKKLTIAGMSLGFAIVTRMLQRYPEIVKKVDLLISVVGFSHHYDFILSKRSMILYRRFAQFFSHKLPAIFFYNLILYPPLLRIGYAKTPNASKKFSALDAEEQKLAIDFEVTLWRENDVRTYMRMTVALMTMDNCHKQVNIPVHHISVRNDRYFDPTAVEQHMRIVFTGFTEHQAILDNHAPSILATKENAAPLVPASIRKVLRKKTT